MTWVAEWLYISAVSLASIAAAWSDLFLPLWYGNGPSTGAEATLATSHHGDTSDSLLGQLSEPKGIMAILLLLGSDIIHRAIAQAVGGKDAHFTPIMFSFGWVGYAFNSISTAIGDGAFLPQPDYPGYVVTIKSGDRRTNQSWVLGRLIRDLEFQVDNNEEEYDRDSALLVTVFKAVGKDKGKHGMYRPKRRRLWMVYVVLLTAQLIVASLPLMLPTGSKGWAVFVITASGNCLAMFTAWLPAIRHAKYQGRSHSDLVYALTRGNGHKHVFLIFPDTLSRQTMSGETTNLSNLPHLEDLATAVYKADSLTRVLAIVSAILWVLMLLVVGGLRTDTWYLLSVGMLGMGHNVYIAGWNRKPEEHGIPIVEFTGSTERPFEDWTTPNLGRKRGLRPKAIDVLLDLEAKYPGAGHALLPLFFPFKLRKENQEQWDDEAHSEKSIQKRFSQKLNWWYNSPDLEGARHILRHRTEELI